MVHCLKLARRFTVWRVVCRNFLEVETMLGSETVAEDDHSGPNDASPSFLGVVAGTLKEMVGKLVSDIEAKPEIQKLLLVIQKSVSGAANEGAAIAKQGSSCVVGTMASREAEVVCTSGMERAMGCRHFCAVHPEVMDPYLWSTLPVGVVQLAFARLSIAKLILDIYADPAWSTMSRSSNFRELCFERHPKLFGLIAHENLTDWKKLCNVVHDIKSKEWVKCDLVGLHRAFGNTADDSDDWRDYMNFAQLMEG